jgi:ATP-dependent RNA helicase DOB1
LKIAATLLSGRSIIYLVPTHALEEQVARNLNSLFSQFPENLLFELEIDLEYTELGDGELPPVSVMTPERCLTTLSVNPQSFHNIGLVVFDEFHLIHGKDNKLERRSVDAMFCLLLLFTEAAQADYMLISAMVQNGQDVADWLAEVLDRKCISFNSSWKPTRQLQGCLVYPEDEIRALETFLGEAVKRKKTITWPKAITDQLIAEPYNFFSLKNTWDSTSSRDYYISKLLDHQVHLGVNEQNKLTSNRNQIAGDFAIHYANMGFKTLVFVDNPIFAKSTADRIAAKMDTPDLSAADFQRSHENLVTRLATELGDIKHSFINLSDKVAVHHGNLLPVERRLNELYFKQKNGIKVIVATATLAQGINLPAEVVIMAGDDRYDEQTGRMEKIQPYEILNTAGRAGRAGSAAQGIVLIVPGVPVTFENFKLSDRWWNLRNTVFSKGDQCLKINDPMEYFLDSLQVEGISLNDQQKNILFRLQEDVESDEATKVFFKKSFAGFLAAKANQQAGFEEKVKFLIEKKRELKDEIQAPNWVDIVSIKMAIEPAIIVALGDYIEETGQEKVLEFNIYDAVAWLMDWIALDQDRIITLFPMPVIQDNLLSVLGFVGKQKTFQNLISGWNGLTPLINLYISGATYIEIENAIGGRHDQFLSKARKFVLKVIPTLSYVFSLFALTLREKMIAEGLSPNDIPYSLKTIASSIREGLDTSEKLRYKYANPQIPRVQVHIDAIL